PSVAAAEIHLRPIPGDPGGFAPSRLLQAACSARLEQESPALVKLLRRAAAIEMARRSELHDAIGYALSAEGFSLAARLVAEAAPQAIARDEIATVRSWLEKLSERASGRASMAAIARSIGWEPPRLESERRLSTRERDVLCCLESGLTGAEAAAKLGVSNETA